MSERQISAGNVTLRPACKEDCRLIWECRNDPDTREASFNTETIFFEDHRAWFESRLGSPDIRFFIILNPEGAGIGYVRFQVKEIEAEVSIALDEQERGKGYGSAAVRAASEELLSEGKVRRVVALIKQSNAGSRQAFEQAGFRFQGLRRVGADEALEMVWDGGKG